LDRQKAGLIAVGAPGEGIEMGWHRFKIAWYDCDYSGIGWHALFVCAGHIIAQMPVREPIFALLGQELDNKTLAGLLTARRQ